MSFDPLHDPTIPSQAPRYYQGRKMFGGRYTLMKRLGSGGMGVVWLAQDNELGIQRALKFAPPEVAADARSVAMLKREAIAGTSLAHPHIVRIFDFVQDTQAGETAVVMEVVEGKSLADLQAERIEATGNGYFEPEEIEPWLQQAAAALDYAHVEGRAHRDLKPQNFMIETATGRLKIMDFGISRRIGDSHATLTGKDSSGTLPYMSPQQVQGDTPSSSDDIYGLGATLYDLLTGSPPFIGGDIPSQVREKPPTPLNQRRAEVNAESGNPIPAAWEQGVLACLSKQREDRPSSAGAAHQFISQMQAKQEAAAESGPHSPLRGSPQAKPPAKPTPCTRSPHDAAGTPPTHPPHQPLRGLSGPLWGAAALVMISLGVWALLSKPKEIIKEVPKLVEDTASKQEAAQQRQRADELEKKHQEEEQKRLAAEAEAKKAREDAAKAALPPPVVPRAVPVGTPATATKSIPFENSLGMKFVPVPIGAGDSQGKRVLFSIWETRSKDYAAFVKDSGHDAGEDWKTYLFKEVPVGRGKDEEAENSSHPVANVSHDDGVAFCAWLTKKDRASGLIGPKDEYRLPTDSEWSYAVGIGDKEDASASPKEKYEAGKTKLADIYPWGGTWPPPAGSGNYADETAKEKGTFFAILGSGTIPNYTDDHATTAPVGSFKANSFGLYDLGGNLWEWTSTEWEPGSTSRVLRGGSWNIHTESYLLSSNRISFYFARGFRLYNYGFRCVLVVGGGG